MQTLIALFSNEWESFLENRANLNPELEKDASVYLSRLWQTILEPVENIEIAVFQSSVFNSTDAFPGNYRRFIQVGNSLEERIRNVFELCFEKGYQRVLFVETFSANTSTKKIQKYIQALEESDMVFVPADNGSIAIAGMDLGNFPTWSAFNFPEPESIVEILSEAIRRNLKYKLFDPYNTRLAESRFEDEIRVLSGKSYRTS